MLFGGPTGFDNLATRRDVNGLPSLNRGYAGTEPSLFPAFQGDYAYSGYQNPLADRVVYPEAGMYPMPRIGYDPTSLAWGQTIASRGAAQSRTNYSPQERQLLSLVGALQLMILQSGISPTLRDSALIPPVLLPPEQGAIPSKGRRAIQSQKQPPAAAKVEGKHPKKAPTTGEIERKAQTSTAENPSSVSDAGECKVRRYHPLVKLRDKHGHILRKRNGKPRYIRSKRYKTKLVCPTAVTQAGKSKPVVLSKDAAANQKAFMPYVQEAAQKHGVDKKLIMALIQAESTWNPNAGSSAGARGLMQLMKGTASMYGCTNRSDPRSNIMAGTAYLKVLLNRYNGNTQLAIAAYNAGEGAVDKFNGIPPYRETQNHVKKVMAEYKRLEGLG